jgi:hypothetical protein
MGQRGEGSRDLEVLSSDLTCEHAYCWGIGQKSFTLEMLEYEFCEWFHGCTSRRKVCLVTRKYSWRSNVDFVQFVNSLTSSETIAELTFGLQVGCLFQGEWNRVQSVSRESVNFGNMTNSWRHELPNCESIKESRIHKSWWMKICMNEASGINRKPSQRRHLKKSGFEACKCMKLALQITGYKRHSCMCSH